MSTATLPELPDLLRIARYLGPVPNERPGGMVRPLLGLVLHVEVGTEAGTNTWFHNSRSQVSAHFGVADRGRLDQWVSTHDRAWAEVAGNSRWLSVETEGYSTRPFTPHQVETLAELYAELHRLSPHEFPLHTADSPNEHGLGWHGMGGAAWGGHTGCPGNLRKWQRPRILGLALDKVHPDASVPAYPGQPLKLGSVGDKVTEWQAKMHDRGWAIAVDGDYGPQSQRVCSEFEAEKHLRVDGEVGDVVWRATWRLPVT